MKTAKISTWTGAFLSLLLLAGCQPSGESDTSVVTAPQESAQETQAEQPEPVGEEVTITITGDDNMRFGTEAFTVQARQPVKIIFKNVGTMPKQSMGHNLVVLKQGVDKTSFANAGMNQASNDYIHPDREDETIAYTAILGPGEEETITFTAPAETGDYDYICTFPGHTAAGMVGVMTVE
ncbi:MAG TPA: plastocyanin/azurin family copper-binding protein [Opitutales bacterium]|nr:plastocyanin/azurin family copper-binding protein [Opitutales bacterium]